MDNLTKCKRFQLGIMLQVTRYKEKWPLQTTEHRFLSVPLSGQVDTGDCSDVSIDVLLSKRHSS